MTAIVVIGRKPMTNEQAIEFINGHIKDSSIAYGTLSQGKHYVWQLKR